MRSAPKRFVNSKKISKKDDRFLSKKEARRKVRICLEEQKQIMSQEFSVQTHFLRVIRSICLVCLHNFSGANTF